MMDLLQSLLMIGSPTHPDSPVLPLLAVGVAAAAMMLRRLGKD